MKKTERMSRRLLDGMYTVAGVLAAACLAMIALLVLAQVAGRWFGVHLPAAEDFAGFLMAATTFLALAWTQRAGAHIRVTLLVRHLDGRLRRWQENTVLAVMVTLSLAMAWSCIALVIESFEYGDTSSGHFAVPLWIPQLPLAIGLIVFSIALVDELLAGGKQEGSN